MLAERLKRARHASGLSLRTTADQVGVSHNAIKKYEKGINTPSSAVLLKLARAFNVRTEYFFRPIEVELKGIEYRKHSNLSKRLLQKIEAEVHEQVERWQELVLLYPDFPVKPFVVPSCIPDQIKTFEAIEDLALSLRRYWALGVNPIADLVDTLETLGIWVLFTATPNKDKFDGLMAHNKQQTLIVVSSHWTGDRQRFTLAHELGHVLLHGRLAADLDEEQACHRFAGAFLLPRDTLWQHIGKVQRHIELREVYLLKQEFGLSIQACLYRLLETGLITKASHKSYMSLFKRQGWLKQEPGEPYPVEKSFLFKQLVYRALAEGWLGESKAAELLSLPLSRFHKERKLETLNAVAHQ